VSAKSWLSGPSRKAAVIRHLPGALVAIDRTALILWASDSVEALVGYQADDLVGRSGLDLIAPEDAETAATALLRSMDSDGVKEPWPLRIVDADGESRWVEMTPSNLLDDPGIGAILIGIRPLDDEGAVAQEARTIEELFRRAFDDAPIGMALVRPNGRFARVNHALCELLQRPIAEVVGADGRSLTHPDDIELERPLVDELLAGERRSYELDKRFVRPDGSVVWVCVGVSLVRTAGGEPERFVVNVQDITHRAGRRVPPPVGLVVSWPAPEGT
jgi:PAS domain S-box-containing protein